MSPELIEVKYALDTFYFLICGALVMWMAAGFTMLEAGLVRAKSTTEILTKNIALYSISCVMYLVMGYAIMYGGSAGGYLPDVWFGNIISNSTAEEVLASNGDITILVRQTSSSRWSLLQLQCRSSRVLLLSA